MRLKKNLFFFIFLIVGICSINAAERDIRQIKLLELENGQKLRELIMQIQKIYIERLPVWIVNLISREIINSVKTYDEYAALLNYIDYVQENRAKEIKERKRKVPVDWLWKFEYDTMYVPIARDLQWIKEILMGKKLYGHITDIYLK